MTLRTEKALISLGLALLLHPMFQGVAAIAITRSVPPPAWLVTAFDQLPVVPAAAWVYLSWYPATAAVLFAGREKFRRTCLAYVLAFAVCIASHLLFPVTIARPAVPPEGGLSMRPTPPTGRSASSRASTLPSRDPVEGTGPVSDGVSGPRLASYLIGVTRRGTGVQPN